MVSVSNWRKFFPSFKGFNEIFRSWEVYFVFLLYNTAEAVLDAVLRPHLVNIVCNYVHSDNLWICKRIRHHNLLNNEVQTTTTNFFIYNKILTNVPALFLGLLCGAWSDRFGRKLPIVMPSLGTTFAVLFYMAANMSPETGVSFFLCGSALQGLFGRTPVIYMAVQSYIVDITKEEKRTNRLGILAAMQFFGMFLGSLIAGVLEDETNVQITFCMVSLLHALVVLVVVFGLRESVPNTETTQVSCSALFQVRNMKDSLHVLYRERTGTKRRGIVILFGILLVHQVCRTGLLDVTVLFIDRPPLSWPKSWFGYLSAVDNAGMGLFLLVVLPILSKLFKLSDVWISILGLVCGSLRLVLMAWSSHTWMVCIAVILGCGAGLINSPLRSLLSKLVDEDEIGKMFSVLGSGETVAKFFGLLLTALYGATVDFFAGLPFLIAAVLYVIIVVVLITKRGHISAPEKTGEQLDQTADRNLEMDKFDKVPCDSLTEVNNHCQNGRILQHDANPVNYSTMDELD